MYQVKTDQFEGPLDVLLALIEKNELDITRLSLARVADQFVAHMETNTAIPLETLADFLDVAARLLLLKSKALLPVLQFTEEEEEEIADLEERLRVYALFKEKVPLLKEMTRGGWKFFSRESWLGLESLFTPNIESLKLTKEELGEAFLKLLEAIPDPKKLKEKILRTTMRLEEKIRHLKQFLSRKGSFAFFEVVRNRRDRGEVVVSFLAMLELVRSRHLSARQDDLFGDIYAQRVSLEE